MEIFFPLCLDAYTREGTPVIRKAFYDAVEAANRKWRTPGNLILKVYPTEFDFKVASAYAILHEEMKEVEHYFFPAPCNSIYGTDQDGEITQRYFFVPELIKELQEFLQKKRQIIEKPLFPLPQIGISARLEREGMTQFEASQASTLFKVEFEACLLEIWSYSSPRLSSHLFRTQPYSIYRMVMPFWKNQEKPEPDNTCGDTSILRDLPPHIKGKGRVTFQDNNNLVTPENQDSWTYRSQTA